MEGAIRRPDAPNHFMVLKPISKRIVVRLPDGTKLAETTSATRVLEAGKTLFDPVIYLPMHDVLVPLTKQDNTTHCPLKGDANYFTIEDGQKTSPDLALLELRTAVRLLARNRGLDRILSQQSDH